MKLKLLTTTAFLGAALVGSAQVNESQNQNGMGQTGREAMDDRQGLPGQDRGNNQSADQSDTVPGHTGEVPGRAGAEAGQYRSGASGESSMNDNALNANRLDDRSATGENRSAMGENQSENRDRSGTQQGETRHGEINLDEAPEAVRNAFTSNAMGGEIDDEVEHISIDGKDVYVASADQEEGEDLQIYVTADGKLLKTQQEIDEDALPEAVRSTFQQQSENQDISDVLKETRDGKISYLAEIDRDDQPDLHVHVDESGSVIKTWEKDESR